MKTEIGKVILRIDGEWWSFDGEETHADNIEIYLPLEEGEEPWLDINGKAVKGERMTSVMCGKKVSAAEILEPGF